MMLVQKGFHLFVCETIEHINTISVQRIILSRGVVIRSSMTTRTFVFPRRKKIMLWCQCCLILAVCNHGHPNSNRYALGASSRNTTVDTVKVCASRTKYRCRMSHIAYPPFKAKMNRVTIEWCPSFIMHPWTSQPLMTIFTSRLWESS